MRRLGVFVGEHGNWSFFRDIYAYLTRSYKPDVFVEKQYNTPLLYGRLNRWNFQHQIKQIVGRNEICFFEWASELLVPASHMEKRCAIVTRLHSYELYAWAPKVNWNNVDRMIFVSKAMRDKFCDIYPDHAHKTRVVNNDKRLDRFVPVGKPFTFQLGMLCSLNPRKRIYEIMLMLSELRALGYDAQLHVAGEKLHGGDLDEYHVALHRLVGKLGLEGAVTFYDHVADPAAWLRNIDIFISNSYWEGQQAALCEAMAAGCQCYSHFWDGAEEVLPPENIYATENQLRDMLIAYSQLSDAERYPLRMNLRTIACQLFDPEARFAQIGQIMDEALAAQR